MSSFDLTPKLSQFFDLHLVIPLLEFIGPLKVCFLKIIPCYIPSILDLQWGLFDWDAS